MLSQISISQDVQASTIATELTSSKEILKESIRLASDSGTTKMRCLDAGIQEIQAGVTLFSNRIEANREQDLQEQKASLDKILRGFQEVKELVVRNGKSRSEDGLLIATNEIKDVIFGVSNSLRESHTKAFQESIQQLESRLRNNLTLNLSDIEKNGRNHDKRTRGATGSESVRKLDTVLITSEGTVRVTTFFEHCLVNM